MVNSSTAFGFRTNQQQAGGCPARMNTYSLVSAFATSIFSGDPVRSIVDSVGGGTLGAYTIERVIADATVRILGIMGGCQYVDAAGNTVFSQFWPASTALLTGTFATVWVYDDPFLELIAQMSTFALTDTNADYDVNMAAGSAVTGRSAAFIDQADVTGSKFRVLGLAPIGEAGRVGPSDIGAFAKVRCRIISHERNALMTTAF